MANGSKQYTLLQALELFDRPDNDFLDGDYTGLCKVHFSSDEAEEMDLFNPICITNNVHMAMINKIRLSSEYCNWLKKNATQKRICVHIMYLPWYAK